jgi:hypothetical protein
MLQVINGVAFSVCQSVQHLRGRFPSNFSVGSHVPHRISGQFEFVQDLGDESMPAFGGRLGFSLLALDIYPEFHLFRHPQFHLLALVLAIESLGQISVLRIGRPRHSTRRRKGTLDSGSVISPKFFRFFILRRSSSCFPFSDSSKINAVKYRQRYANFSFDITGSYLTVLGLHLHKSQRDPLGNRR